MKKALITVFLVVLSFSMFAQSGITTFKYELRAPSIRIGGATKVKLDSIVQNADTIKFFTGGTELFSKGAGSWTGTGIGLDTTWARLSLAIDQVTNESKATMFTSPTFTGIATIGTALTPDVDDGATLGTFDVGWSDMYIAPDGTIVFVGTSSITLGQNEFGDLAIDGHLNLGTHDIFLTGGIGDGSNRVMEGWFTDLNVTNAITGSVTGNAATVTGYTRNSGSITLSGGHAITATTTGVTGITLPTTGTLATTSDMALKLSIADTADFIEPYIMDSEARIAINDSIVDRIANATIGVAAADSNIYSGYTTLTYVESLLGSGSGLNAERLPFIIGVTSGAPSAADSIVVHSSFEGKHIDLYRDGAKQYQNFTATNTVEGFRVSEDTIFVNPAWQANEQVLVDIIQPVMWSYLSFTDTGELTDSLLSYWKMDESSGNLIDALGYKNLSISGAPTPQQTGKINYCWSYDGVDDFHGVSDTLYLNHRDKFTASAWVKTAATDSDGAIVGAIDGAGSGWGWFLNIISTTGYARFNLYDGTTHNYTTGTTDVADQAWHHIVITYDGTTATIYVDGTSEGTPVTADIVYAQYAFFRINRSDGQYLDASIDNIAYWNKCLDATEVSNLYDAESAGIEYPWN